MNRTYLRGDMYYADLGRGVGSEQEGYRPVLIIQNDTGNKYSTTVIVAAISSKVDAKAKLPTHYLLKAENGLELPSLVLLEQLRTIDKRRLEHYIGRLDEHHIRRVNRALAISVGLIEEVPKNLIMCLAQPVPTIFTARALIICGELIRSRNNGTSVPTADRILVTTTRLSRSRRGGDD